MEHMFLIRHSRLFDTKKETFLYSLRKFPNIILVRTSDIVHYLRCRIIFIDLNEFGFTHF